MIRRFGSRSLALWAMVASLALSTGCDQILDAFAEAADDVAGRLDRFGERNDDDNEFGDDLDDFFDDLFD